MLSLKQWDLKENEYNEEEGTQSYELHELSDIIAIRWKKKNYRKNIKVAILQNYVFDCFMVYFSIFFFFAFEGIGCIRFGLINYSNINVQE